MSIRLIVKAVASTVLSVGMVFGVAAVSNASVTPKAPAASTAAAPAAPTHPRHCTARSCPAVMINTVPWDAQLWPRAIYFGQGGAPYLLKLNWPTYTHTKGVAHGYLHAQIKSCTPKSSCKYYVMKVKLITSRPRFHTIRCGGHNCGGGWYYSEMNAIYTTRLKIGNLHWWHVNKHGFWVLGKS